MTNLLKRLVKETGFSEFEDLVLGLEQTIEVFRLDRNFYNIRWFRKILSYLKSTFKREKGNSKVMKSCVCLYFLLMNLNTTED